MVGGDGVVYVDVEEVICGGQVDGGGVGWGGVLGQGRVRSDGCGVLGVGNVFGVREEGGGV